MKRIVNNQNRGPRRVLSVAIAAGVACSLLFGGGIASADGPQNGGNIQPQGTRITRGVQGGGLPTLKSTNLSKVSAGPARPGVSAKLCNDFAAAINNTIGGQMEAMHDGNVDAANAYAGIVEGLKNSALDAGCFVIE